MVNYCLSCELTKKCFVTDFGLSLTITTTARFIGIKEAAFSLLIVTVTPTTGVTGYWTRLSLSGNLETIVGDGVNYAITSLGNLMIMKFKSSEQGLYVFNATDGTETAHSAAIKVAMSGRCSIVMWNNITNIYYEKSWYIPKG
jgi:hypothetical protein